MRRARTKNTWILIILMLVGFVLGTFIAELTSNISSLSWLSYGNSFGFSNPITLNLGMLVLTFGLTIHISIAGIIGLLLAAFIYRFI